LLSRPQAALFALVFPGAAQGFSGIRSFASVAGHDSTGTRRAPERARKKEHVVSNPEVIDALDRPPGAGSYCLSRCGWLRGPEVDICPTCRATAYRPGELEDAYRAARSRHHRRYRYIFAGCLAPIALVHLTLGALWGIRLLDAASVLLAASTMTLVLRGLWTRLCLSLPERALLRTRARRAWGRLRQGTARARRAENPETS
jgi:hypothetical protein